MPSETLSAKERLDATWYTAQDVATFAGVTPGTVINWAKDKMLPFRLMPRRAGSRVQRRRFLARDVYAFFVKNRLPMPAELRLDV